MDNIAIIGAGGFGREVRAHFFRQDNVTFFVEDQYYDDNKPKIKPLIDLNKDFSSYIIAIGDGAARKRIYERYLNQYKSKTIIHPTAQLLDQNITIWRGGIICAGCILTTNIEIGIQAHLNLHTSIGHDTKIGDYFTTAPGARISGNCKIGDNVYIGTNAAVRQGVTIVDNVHIGMNAAVVKDILEPGTYVGVPAVKIK